MDAQIATNPVNPTVGSLFAGIGGFDLGFEQVGFRTEWQVEIADIPRAVLADHFPHAKQFTDVRTCLPELWHTDVIIGGFPCQDVSMAGKRRGLAGERTGLFFDALNIVSALKPRWLVLENVPGCSSNDGRDFQTVVQSLAQCGYVGYWRVLDASYFEYPRHGGGSFVAGLGEQPPIEFMADAGAVCSVAGKGGAGRQKTHRTLLAGIAPAVSTERARILSLSPADGVRWLSGAERLQMMGFAKDWMQPTLQRLGLPETPSVRRLRAGSLKVDGYFSAPKPLLKGIR